MHYAGGRAHGRGKGGDRYSMAQPAMMSWNFCCGYTSGTAVKILRGGGGELVWGRGDRGTMCCRAGEWTLGNRS